MSRDGPANGLYLYTVVPSASEPPDADAVVQPSAGSLTVVRGKSAGLLAGPMCSPRVAVTRENLEAHQSIVEGAAAGGAVLPFRFGVVLDSVEHARSWLCRNDSVLSRMLERMSGVAEMRVTVRYKKDEVLRDVLSASREARRLQERIRRRSDAASYYDRIALGDLVASSIAGLRTRDVAAVTGVLGRGCRAERRLRANGEWDVCRVAYLVEAGQLPAFESAVTRLAESEPFARRAEFEEVGPLAPWDFVDLDGELALQGTTGGP